MDRWVGKVAVITGTSAGIGLAIAKALVSKGMIVVGLSRRKGKMVEGMKNVNGPGQFHAMECDVTKNEDVVRVFEKIKNDFGGIHVLINNAGKMDRGSTADLDVERIKQVIDTNMCGIIYCSKQAVNVMKEGDHEGVIINVGSTLGHKVMYVEGFSMNAYSATKFAVRAFSQTLQNELRGTKIRVTHLSPGIVKTDFFEVAGADPNFLNVVPGLESNDVADAIVYVIGTKPYVSIPELTVMHLKDYYR